MRDRIIALVTRHCETLRAEAAGIAELMPRTARDGDIDYAALVSRVHKLKGGSGTIGFSEICAAALQLEERLRVAMHVAPGTAEFQALIDAHAALQHLVDRIEPQQSSLYHRFP